MNMNQSMNPKSPPRVGPRKCEEECECLGARLVCDTGASPLSAPLIDWCYSHDQTRRFQGRNQARVSHERGREKSPPKYPLRIF